MAFPTLDALHSCYVFDKKEPPLRAAYKRFLAEEPEAASDGVAPPPSERIPSMGTGCAGKLT
jgi:hypothetical protein